MADNTIVRKAGAGDVQREGVANAAITPGHLVEVMSSGNYRVHSTAGGNAESLFAIEDELQGNTITDAYSANNAFQFVMAGRGTEIYALLKNGETAVIGSWLESAGDGTLQVHVPDIESGGDNIIPENIVAIATEAVDMSDSSAADPNGRINVRVV